MSISTLATVVDRSVSQKERR